MVEVRSLDIPEVKLVETRRFSDERGYFTECWNRAAFAEAGLGLDFCQDNQSLSRHSGTVRGLHFQSPPRAQAKLVRVLQGSVFDVAVDLRRGSPSFGRWVSAELSAENGRQILIPKGFAHGFCTLEPDTIVSYRVDDFYDKACDLGLLWNDPDLGIPWPVSHDAGVLSEKDRKLPSLTELEQHFAYGEPED